VVCSSQTPPLDEYIASIGRRRGPDHQHAGGDTQWITEYARRCFAVEQDMPDVVRAAYQRVVGTGFTSRLI